MTNSRRSFQAFQKRLAVEENKPLWAFAKALFIGFIGFNLLMGFMLGTVPLAMNVINHTSYYVIRPMGIWINEMGWEGQVTLFALNAMLMLIVLYIARNYLALAIRALIMLAVDAKNWFYQNVIKRPNDSTNIAAIKPREPVAAPNEKPKPASKYDPPVVRDNTPDTAIVAG